MGNRFPIVADEWYHCFNRGVDKRIVFGDESDCERFMALLFVSNDEDSNTRLFDLDRHKVDLSKVIRYDAPRGAPLVRIGAYALMPNHVHFIVQPLTDAGLARFMHKVFTGYTMYFNKKYERAGPLFSGKYKSKHLDTDEYFKHAVQYVLFNPVEIFEPNWKKGIGDLPRIERELRAYRYASVQDFFRIERPEKIIVHDIVREYFDKKPSLSAMLKDAHFYYKENAKFLDA